MLLRLLLADVGAKPHEALGRYSLSCETRLPVPVPVKSHRGEPGRTRDTVPVGILPRSGLRRNHLGGGRVEAPAVTGRSSSRRRRCVVLGRVRLA